MLRKERRPLWLLLIVAALYFYLVSFFHAETNPPVSSTFIAIDIFYEPGCSECQRVEEEILPVLEARYGGLYILRRWDLSVSSNYVRLVSLLHQYGVTRNAHVFMAVNESRVFAGIREITENLLPCVDQVIISGRANPVNENPVVTSAAKGRDLLVSRVSRFTIPGVMVAGLLDGINPCAISTLVFLLSFLTVGRLRGRRLLLVGLVFCLATFLTYGAVGFGLLRALHALSWFPSLRKTVDLLLVAVLLTLAVYSLRDAFRFRRSGSANDVVLKLPQAARERIGRIAHKTRGAGFQLAGVFILGVCVTALESVCTGQVYVPTLALVVRMGTSVFRGFLLLCLYNLMFVVPLIVIVALMYRGLGIMALLEWSKRNVFFSKLLLGGFFLALAGVFLLLNR